MAAMLDALAGYGAACARWTKAPVGLGGRHDRPPAADTGKGTLPRRGAPPESPLRLHPDAGVAVLADARLDGRGLGDALGLGPRERAECTDGDLILRAWLRWGRECPGHLLGDYAFVVWDAGKRLLFCARDHIGARPFYYALTADRFVFASAVEAVLAAPGISGELDERTVAAYLTQTSLNTAAHTFFKAVRKLPPGHALTLEADRLPAAGLRARLERHWRPERTPRAPPASDDDYAGEFLHLYRQAVKDRLRGPGPVGAHLSGGLDSSSIAVLAARELRRQGRPPPLAFSWLPELGGRPPDESHAPEYALVDAVCAQEGLRVFHQAPGTDDVIAVLRQDVTYPGVHVHLNEWVVQRCAAEQGVRVLLSGWGGDEGVSFNGNGHFASLLLRGRWMALLAACRAHGERPRRFLARLVLPLVHPHLPLRLRMLRSGRWPFRRSRRWLIDPAFARRTRPWPEHTRRNVGVRRLQLWRLQTAQHSRRMEGWAASGARHGIEYRYPLLDRRLLEFALSLPPEQFSRGRWDRWLMRYALSGGAGRSFAESPVLPADVCWNAAKTDPARFDAMIDAVAEALPEIGRGLAARSAPPSRARYIDMPRLLERLDAAHVRRKKPRLAPMLNALQFLDF